MDSNVTEYEKFIVGSSDSTQQLSLKRPCLWSWGFVSKKNSHKYLEGLLKYSSLFQGLNGVGPAASCALAQTAHLRSDGRGRWQSLALFCEAGY